MGNDIHHQSPWPAATSLNNYINYQLIFWPTPMTRVFLNDGWSARLTFAVKVFFLSFLPSIMQRRRATFSNWHSSAICRLFVRPPSSLRRYLLFIRIGSPPPVKVGLAVKVKVGGWRACFRPDWELGFESLDFRSPQTLAQMDMEVTG